MRVVIFTSFLYCFLFLVGCSEGNTGKQSRTYYYYPNKNIYFDVRNNTYLYSFDGGKNWNSLEKGDKEAAIPGKRITIETAGEDVYKLNAEHRKLYGGTLLNILSGPEDTLSVAEVSERRVMQKSKWPMKQPEKPKSGFKKFIDNIFGKGKKKETLQNKP